MQKTSVLHRLLAVLVAVFLAVCCLPTSAFAAQSKISSHVFVTLKLDGEEKGKKDFWLGDLPYEPGSRSTKVAWSTLLENLKLPENTRVKADTKGDCELPLRLNGAQEPPTFRSDLTVELEPEYEIEFTVRYVGSGGADLGSHTAKVLYSPSGAQDAWKYISESETFKAFKAPLKELKIEQDGDKAYTEADHLKIGPDVQGKTLVAYLDKSADADPRTVNFTLRYLSTDNQIQDTQPATLTYKPDDQGTDVWDFVMDQAAYKTYEAQGYKMEDYVIPAEGGERLCDKQGLQNVNADLEGKEIIVHLVKKAVEVKPEQVPFRLSYRSTDGNIADDKDVEVPYNANGNTYDLWRYIESTGAYKGYQAAGYTMKSFVVPHLDGEKTYTGAGQFTVTPSLRGAIVTVTLDKPVVPAVKKSVDFTVKYTSNDGAIDLTKHVSVQYDPEGTVLDLWDYLGKTSTVQSYGKVGYALKKYELDGRTIEMAGVCAVNETLKNKTVTVHLYKEPVPTEKTVDFQLRYLSTDHQIQDTQPATLTYDPEGVLTDAWDFVLDQEAYKTYAAQGYELSDYVVPAEGGDRLCEHRGMQAVTIELQGKTVIVHLVKKAVEVKPEQVPFRLAFRSTDGNIVDDKNVEVPYNANGKTYDLWSYIESSGAYKSYQTAGYTMKNFVVPHLGGDKTYTGAGQFTVTPALRGAIVTVTLDKPMVRTTKTVDFTVKYLSNDNVLDVTKQVSVQYDPEGVLTDLWDYLGNTGTVQAAKKDGYTLQDYLLNDRTVKTHGVQAVDGTLAGKTVTVHLYKEPVPTEKTVSFTLRYLSTDNKIQDSQPATLTYDPEGVLTDAWDFVLDQEAYKTYAAQGYELSDYVITRENGDLNGVARGIQAVTTDLEGKTVIVHLVKKAVEVKPEQVPFRLAFRSTDGNIVDDKNAEVPYNANGKTYDLWSYIESTGSYKSYQTAGYTMKNFVVPHPHGDKTYTGAGQFTVTPALRGTIITVELVKQSTVETVDFALHFLSEDGKIDVTKNVSVPYDPNGKSYDAWNYLLGTGSFRNYAKEGYTLKDLVAHHAAGDKTYTHSGEFTLTPALSGETLLVHLDKAKEPARYESNYTIHFVDEKGQEFQPAVTVKVNWTEGQQLNLMAQLQESFKTVSAKGYTFRTLTAWNGTATYKGTELVVPGNWELAAHCVKNAAPAPTPKPENKPAPTKPAENKPAQTAKPAATPQPAQAKAKPAAAPAKAVVKANTPAANNTKILPKTGLQAESPVVFAIMLFAALAGAAVYLFAVRKKLN